MQTGEVQCLECMMLLNGYRQWQDHKKGRKHNKNKLRNRRLAIAQERGDVRAGAWFRRGTDFHNLDTLD